MLDSSGIDDFKNICNIYFYLRKVEGLSNFKCRYSIEIP